MRQPLPPLSALRAFEATARLGSASGAAAELGRTHGAVSKQLRVLTDEVGIALFDKVGTGIRANAAGQRLAAAIGEAFDMMSARYGELKREARSPAVHVACSASFAMGWLVPHLPKFSGLHPEVRIRLSMTSAREMRDERDADLVVLWNRAAYPREDQARAIRLADCAFTIVCAPGYPFKLTRRALAVASQIRHEHTARAWSHWSETTRIRIDAASAMVLPHTHLCVGAAVAGMGVAIAERRMAASPLAAGQLIEIGEAAAFPDGFAAIPNARKPLSAEARQFIAWLQRELETPT